MTNRFKKPRVKRINRRNRIPSVKKRESLMKLMEDHFDFVMNRLTKLVEQEHFDFVVLCVRTKRSMTKTRLETKGLTKH